MFEWGSRAEVGKKRDAVLPQKPRTAAASSSADLEWTGAGGDKPTGWTAGDQELLAEYWSLDTTPRPLLLIRAPAAPARPPMLRPGMPGLTPGMMPPSGMLPPPGMLPPGMPPPGPLPPYPPPGGPPMPPSPGMPPIGPPMPGQAPPRLTGPGGPPPLPVERAVFEDEYQQIFRPRGWRVVRELRIVDDPTVTMRLTDGRDVLHETAWPGRYIPIVSCYGKVLYVPEGGQVKRRILSMTRFGRDPWKAYCYCCSQELEVLSMVPKAPIMAVEGQLGRHAQEVGREHAHAEVGAVLPG